MDALPGERLPPGWTRAKVGEVGLVQLGRQRSPQYHQGPNMRPYLRVANVFEDRIDISDLMEMDFDAVDFAAYRLEPGDILLNEGQSAELVGRPAMFKGELADCCFTNTLVRFRCGQAVLPDYALLLFRNWLHDGTFQRIAKITTNIAHLGAGRFAALAMPVAPLDEQARIVAAVNALFEEVEAGEAALARAREGLTQFRASLLHAACTGALTADWRAANPTNETGGDLLQQLLAVRGQHSGRRARLILAPDLTDEPPLPPGWCWASVDQITNFLGNGLARAPVGDPMDRRILRISAVRPMKVDEGEHRFYRPLPEEDLAGATTQRHDLLFTRYSGSEQYVGVCGLVRFDDPLLFPDKVMCARPLPGFADLAEYLELALNAGPSRAYIARNIRTTAGQKGIAGSSIRACPVPLPPRRELLAIVTAVREAQTDGAELPADGFATALRQSILHAAFTGRLVPQDPADEPAAALLARLRAAPATTRRPRQRRAAAQPDLIETQA